MFVKGFDKFQGEDAVREALTEFFQECGEISAIRLPSDRESGELKGIGFVEFATPEAKVRQGLRSIVLSYFTTCATSSLPGCFPCWALDLDFYGPYERTVAGAMQGLSQLPV